MNSKNNTKFLMYRVELKGTSCFQTCLMSWFLMYRVELKVFHPEVMFPFLYLFLMYRVELKVALYLLQTFIIFCVPNVPYGIEKELSETA